MLRSGLLAGALAFCGVAHAQIPPAAKSKIEFTRDIEPLLTKRCVVCHGSQQQMGGRRLDQKDAALKGGASGADIVPDKSADSRLIRLVAGMEKSRLRWARSHRRGDLRPRAWIDRRGMARHESAALVLPEDLRGRPPAVRDRAWPRNPIDNFIPARLEHEGIAPLARGGKLTMLRAASASTDGLPPP